MHTRTVNRIANLIIVLVLLASAGTPAGANSQAAAPIHPAAQLQAAPADGTVVARVYFTSIEEKNALASQLDVWKVNQKESYLLVLLQPGELEALQSAGYRVEIDEAETARLAAPRSIDLGQTEGIPGYPCYRTVEENDATLQQLVTDYPTLVTLTDIGNSWDKFMVGGNPGYDIWRLRITNQAIPGPKPTFYLIAEVHAREYATAELATRFAEYLLHNYGTDPVITYFMDYSIIDVVPMVNPDGRKIAEGGDLWRKNVDNDDGCTYSGSWGVDLNRNYPFKWGCCGGSSGNPCDEIYRGPLAGSEPETAAIQNDVLAVFPDQRGPGDTDPAPTDATGLFITLHSAASLVLWPWGWTGTDAPNGPALQAIGQKLASYNGYTPQQSNDLYTTDGTTDDWTYGALGVASYTYELAGDFFQPCSAFEATDWPDNRDSLLYAMKISATPYMTAYGPDTLNTAAIPGLINPGEPVQLTASINDLDNGNQTIQGAEYYLLPLHSPTPPGDPGTGTAMQPADGSWNATVETAVAEIDTTSLTTGTYLLAVRGKDAGNHWGPFSVAFLYVAEPGVSPVIQGYVREAGTNLPLAATVTAGNFSTTTDPATGFYSMIVISGTYDLTAEAADHAPITVPDVQVENYQILEQDFYLSPICEVFGDDMENGINGWTAGGTPNTWAQTTSQSHSPTHSWTDSPSGNYQNNANNWVATPVFDLSEYTGTTLSFWHRYNTESGYDYATIEYSINGGSTWTALTSYDGSHTSWSQETFAIPALDGQANARLRFHLTADYYQVYDGWYVDDVSVTGGGPACQPLSPPTAEFTSNSPVLLGDPVIFTNQTTGTPPFTWAWDFGDGSTSTDENPTHVYPSVGVFDVTLTATNSEGSDSVTHPVEVQELVCLDLSGATVSVDTPGPIFPGDLVAFTGDLSPDEATPPYYYTVDFGDGTTIEPPAAGEEPLTFEHAFAAPGDYTVTLEAWNCAMVDPVQVTVQVTVLEPVVCDPLAAISLDLATSDPVYAGLPASFSADLLPDTATKPYTYTIDFGDGTAPVTTTSSADPLSLAHTYAAAGTFTATISAWNCDAGAAVTGSVPVTVLEAPTCDPIQGLGLTAQDPVPPGTPVVIPVDVYPESATAPFNYTVDYGDGVITSGITLDDPFNLTHLYAMTGSYTATVSAWNCNPGEVVSNSILITVAEPEPCIPLTSVGLTITPTAPLFPGDPFLLSADFLPDDASKPYHFILDYGDGSAPITQTSSLDPLVSAYAYTSTGIYTLTFSAWNCDPEAPVTDTLVITVQEPLPLYPVYLPLILRPPTEPQPRWLGR